MKVAVLGASGAIGKTVGRTLLSRDIAVRVVGRSEQKLRAAFVDSPVEYVAADLAEHEGCVRALEGVDAAVYTLGLPYTKSAFATYPKLMRTLLEAAGQTQLRKLLLIANVYPYGVPEAVRVDETHPRNPVAIKGRFRKEQEDLVLAAHDPDGLSTMSLRLPDFYGPEAELSLAHGIFQAAVAGKKADLLGPIDTPHEFVFTPDVGPIVADLLQKEEAFGTAYNFAGAGAITMKKFTEDIYAAAGRGKAGMRVVQGPMLRVVGLFLPILREMVEMEYLFKTPVLLDDSKLKSVLGDLRKTSYDDGIRQTLAAYRERR